MCESRLVLWKENITHRSSDVSLLKFPASAVQMYMTKPYNVMVNQNSAIPLKLKAGLVLTAMDDTFLLWLVKSVGEREYHLEQCWAQRPSTEECTRAMLWHQSRFQINMGNEDIVESKTSPKIHFIIKMCSHAVRLYEHLQSLCTDLRE